VLVVEFFTLTSKFNEIVFTGDVKNINIIVVVVVDI
jgi:hypothetical protein